MSAQHTTTAPRDTSVESLLQYLSQHAAGSAVPSEAELEPFRVVVVQTERATLVVKRHEGASGNPVGSGAFALVYPKGAEVSAAQYYDLRPQDVLEGRLPTAVHAPSQLIVSCCTAVHDSGAAAVECHDRKVFSQRDGGALTLVLHERRQCGVSDSWRRWVVGSYDECAAVKVAVSALQGAALPEGQLFYPHNWPGVKEEIAAVSRRIGEAGSQFTVLQAQHVGMVA